MEDISSVGNDTDGLFRQMKLTKVEMCLEVLKGADQVIFYILRAEDTGVALRGYTKKSPEALSVSLV